MTRVWRWWFGDLVVDAAARQALWLTAWAGAGMWLGLLHGLHAGPLPLGCWRFLVHGALPLVGAATWQVGLGARGRVLALVALLVAALPIAGRLFGQADWLVALPLVRFLGPALLSVALSLGAIARAGGALSDWGLGRGDWRWWSLRVAVAAGGVLAFVAIGLWVSPGVRQFYPMWDPARTSAARLAELCCGLAIDMVAWEFLFRGLLLMPLARSHLTLAVIVQALPFFLLHADKPEAEMLSSLPGGVLAAWFALRAGSCWPTVLLHVVMLCGVNVLGFLAR
jgi:membrane protease YdiL (CAAX protease family)